VVSPCERGGGRCRGRELSQCCATIGVRRILMVLLTNMLAWLDEGIIMSGTISVEALIERSDGAAGVCKSMG
jgi:hypothetical protein